MSTGNESQAKGEIILFQSNDGQTKIQVRVEDKSVWLTQAGIAELFQTTPQNITLHLKSIYEEGELTEAATCKEYLQVRQEGKPIGQDYFDELLLRIRDIRASERRFYQKITDIYATSIDYDGRADVTQEFYATVQNKLHWATHGKTAAEVIKSRADASKKNMGLTTWKNSPDGIEKQG